MLLHVRQVLSHPGWRFADSVLRGVGQVMMQNNPLTGFLFLLGLFISDWVSGLSALLGTIIATWTAMLFGAPRCEINRGVYGFNGTLVGLGLAFYLEHEATWLVYALAYVVVAAMFVTIVTAAIKHILGTHTPELTGPFVITTWIFTGALLAFSHLSGSPSLMVPQLPTGTIAVGPAAVTTLDVITSILNGPAQVMLQQNAWTGAIFLLGIAVNSRISCLAAVLGSALGMVVARALGAAPGDIRAGLYGFNGVMTAMALGGIFFLFNRHTVLLAVLAVCVSTILFGTFVIILKPLGLPVLTAPFVFTTWLCLLGGASLPRLAAFSPLHAGTPEGNLRAARRAAASRK